MKQDLVKRPSIWRLCFYVFVIYLTGEALFVLIRRFLSDVLGFFFHGAYYVYSISSMCSVPLFKGLTYGLYSILLLAVIYPLTKKIFHGKFIDKFMLLITASYMGIKTSVYILPWASYQLKDFFTSFWLYLSAIGSYVVFTSVLASLIYYLLLYLFFKIYKNIMAHVFAGIVVLPFFLTVGFLGHTRYIGSMLSKESFVFSILLLLGSLALYTLLIIVCSLIGKCFHGIINKMHFDDSPVFFAIALFGVLLILNAASFIIFKTRIEPKGKSAERPNIVILVLDALRTDYLSCNGYPGKITPNIDMIASRGYLYPNYYSSATFSMSSYTTMLTGLHPSYHRMQHAFSDYGIKYDMQTLTQVLKDNGYLTAMFTENGFISKEIGNAKGFDHINTDWIDYEVVTSELLMNKGLRAFLRASWPRKTRKAFFNFTRTHLNSLHVAIIKYFRQKTLFKDKHSAMTKRAEAWIARNGGRGMPLFTFVVLLTPHQPYVSPAQCANRFIYGKFEFNEEVEDFFLSYCYARGLTRKIFDRERWISVGESIGTVQECTRAMYAGSVNHCDHITGHLYRSLEKNLDIDNTVFIVTSDHGEDLEERQVAFNHTGCLYNTVIKTPLVVTFPKELKGGVVVEKIAQSVDLTPSLLSLAKVDYNMKEFQGFDTLFVKDPVSKEKDRVIFVECPELSMGIDEGRQAIIHGRYKYMRSKERDEYYLYDLENDPTERNNLIDNKKQLALDLDNKLDLWLRQYARKKPELTGPRSESVRELLKSLGYM